ncbi:MAG: 4Fe-4S binding protein [Proteobacteria bacterium]|nr:4Fe-4S binding protein [Pseudomonadota bacterium]MCP4919843.1 4Fe-4S binding protein [Pseudomonadota bacterium]
MKWLIAAFRRFCQVTSLTFVAYAAISLHWRNAKVSHNQDRIVGLMNGEHWGRLYGWNEDLLSLFGRPEEVSNEFLGMPWSATIAGVTFTDPLSVVGLLVQGEVPATAMLLGALIPLAVAVVAGKLFCSFLCPARLVFEIGNLVRMGLVRIGLHLPALRLPRVGLWIALGVVLASASAGLATFHVVLPYLALGSGIAMYLTLGTVSVAAWVFLGMLAVDVFVAPGQICRALCPTGAVLEQLGRAAPLRVDKLEKTDCGSCTLCTRVCPYGLDPGREQHHPACDACGRCTLVCPAEKLAHTLSLRRKTA